jgi:hypothetical protein
LLGQLVEQHDSPEVHVTPLAMQAFVGDPVSPNTVGFLVGLADAGAAHFSLVEPDPDVGHTLEQHDAPEVHDRDQLSLS